MEVGKDQNAVRSGERFMPCVLSRLTDTNPQIKVEHYSRVITLKQLRRDIVQNVELILNSRSHPSRAELENDPLLLNSVLGFGLSDFCGHSHARERLSLIEQEIVNQIRCFEPRINPESLTVRINVDESRNYSDFLVEISGMVQAAPLAGEILFFSRIDVESGVAEIKYNEE